MMQRRWPGLLAVALVVFTGLSAVFAQDAPAAPAPGKTVDLVLCLDASGSMQGLIDSAKIKLWDIVNDLAKAKPTPTLRVALYSYGNDGYDKSNGWIRKEVDFTTDLDIVNQKLFAITINGGTEYATRVCRDAIMQQKWSEGNSLKLVFVCGNEAATQDQENKLKDVAELAVRKGIIVNTIYCGALSHADAEAWKQFADLSEGRFASIDQQRGAVAVSTPFDKELNDLGQQINLTFCFFGREAKAVAENQRLQDANAAGVAPGLAAARSQTKGTALYRFENDLVDKLQKDPKFDVTKVPAEELPDELKKMTPEERAKHIKELLAKREELQKKIADLGKKRDAYIQEQLKKDPSNADKAFDAAVRGMLRDQAQKKGIAIP